MDPKAIVVGATLGLLLYIIGEALKRIVNGLRGK